LRARGSEHLTGKGLTQRVSRLAVERDDRRAVLPEAALAKVDGGDVADVERIAPLAMHDHRDARITAPRRARQHGGQYTEAREQASRHLRTAPTGRREAP